MRTARLVVIAIAVASALAARAIAHFALADVAHVMDEIAYLFQAKIFASGALKAPVLEPRAAFNMWFVDDRTARFGIFPPGWPAFLALGVKLGVPRLVNPLLHLGTVIVVGRAGEKLGGPRAGIAAAVLYGACPQTVILAASLMSHTLVAACASVVLLAVATVLVAPDSVGRRLVVASGVAIGICALTRPLCALAIGLPLVVLVALRVRRHFVLLDAAALPFVLLLGLYDRALTGSAFRPPQTAYFDEHLPPADIPFFTYGPGCNALGFGHACDHTVRAAKHTLVSALSDAGDNLTAWLILVGPIVLGAALWAVRNRRWRVLLAPAGLVVVLYGLYWQAGVCYGARFYHAAIPALIVAAALVVHEKRWIIAAALAWNVGGYAVAARELTSWPFWGTDDRFAELASHWREPGPALVLVQFGQDDVKSPALHAMGAQGPGTWLLGVRALGALGENSPTNDGPVVFAKYHPALVPQFAGTRRRWLYTAWADRSKDTLVPLDGAPSSLPPPPPNFDGFRVGPPLEAPTPLFTEPQ